MIDAELKTYINNMIDAKLSILLTANIGDSDQKNGTIENLYGNANGITQRPIAMPFGVSSKVPRGTSGVVGQSGADRFNRFFMGFFDKNRPMVGDGETSIYSVGKYEVRVLKDKIQLGKNGTFETAVVGETLAQFINALLDAIVAHDHLGNLGFPTGKPLNAAAFEAARSAFISNEEILSKDGGRF